jgi:peptidoglycan/LPS O-acetylase OafA/YrhL
LALRVGDLIGYASALELDNLDILGALFEQAGAGTGSLLLLSALLLLRMSWARRHRRWNIAMIAGWMLAAAGVATFARVLGSEVGTALALGVFSALAYFVVAAGFELRGEKQRPEREVSLEPEDRPTNWPRAIAKSLLAIVLAGIAAVGIGVAFAVATPMAPTDRIVIGGLLVPMLWGAGMAWTLSDAKLLRATLLLGLISALAYGVAFIPKVLAS